MIEESVREEIVAEYRRLTPASHQHWASSLSWTVDGINRTGGVTPYPSFIDRSDGAYLYDLDGREIVDFEMSNMGGVLGHNHPAVRLAVIEQLGRGVHYTMMPANEARVAEQLVRRIPSMEAVRFTATGGEATMYALRVARAYTGRSKIAKTDAGFHGSHDAVWMGMTMHHAQSPGRLAPGILASIDEQVVVVPFNDVKATSEALRGHADELAALIIEPVLGGAGCIPATQSYLETLRAVTADHGIILIFDEMISQGMSRGGAQDQYGVAPDLTTGGKAVCAGFPMAFYGGRRDIMALTGRGSGSRVPQVFHVGTHNSHPVSMAASAAALDQMDDTHYHRINALGALVRRELTSMFDRRRAPLTVTGLGHMWGWWVGTQEVTDYRVAESTDLAVADLIQTSLLNKGFYMRGRRAIVSAAHSEEHVLAFVGAMECTLEECGLVGDSHRSDIACRVQSND